MDFSGYMTGKLVEMENVPVHYYNAPVICMYAIRIVTENHSPRDKFWVELTWNSRLCHQEFPTFPRHGWGGGAVHTND